MIVLMIILPDNCYWRLQFTANDQLISKNGIEGIVAIFWYPKIGKPVHPSPKGWDKIPGDRGCTPQACSFRDHYKKLSMLKVSAFGLRTQTTAYQKEVKEKLKLHYHLMSDESLSFTKQLNLPFFSVT